MGERLKRRSSPAARLSGGNTFASLRLSKRVIVEPDGSTRLKPSSCSVGWTIGRPGRSTGACWAFVRRVVGFCVAFLAFVPVLARGAAVESNLGNVLAPELEHPATKISREIVADRFKDALDLFALGRTDAAIYALQQLSADDPTNVAVLLKLSELAIATKNWAYAINVLDKAAKLKPRDIPTRQVLMDIYKAYQMPVQEIHVGREILALDPRNLRALRRMASLYRDLDMPNEETDIRFELADLEPGNEANLRTLAHLLWESGEPWEEVVVHKKLVAKYPGKTRYLRRLAVLYGDEKIKDWFNQLQTVEKVPGWKKDPTMAPIHKRAVKTYRKDLRVLDVLDSTNRVATEKAQEFKTDQIFLEESYMFRPLRKQRDHGVWARTIHTDYRGQNELAGKRTIDEYSFQGRSKIYTERGRNTLLLGLGATHVSVGGSLWSRDGEELSVTDYPFLENRPYGGTNISALADFVRMQRPRLELRATLLTEVMEELDAQVRGIQRSTAAMEAVYFFSDSTHVSIRNELWCISDGNRFKNSQFSIERYLLGTRPIHDFRGHRSGFILMPPSSSLKVRYQFDYKDHLKDSPYYQAYQNEIEKELRVTGELRLSPKLFLLAEGVKAKGNHTLSKVAGYRAGIGYRDRYKENEILLEYSDLTDKVNETSQLNATLRGVSAFKHVQLSGRWHF